MFVTYRKLLADDSEVHCDRIRRHVDLNLSGVRHIGTSPPRSNKSLPVRHDTLSFHDSTNMATLPDSGSRCRTPLAHQALDKNVRLLDKIRAS